MCSGEDMKWVVRKFEGDMNMFYAGLRETWNVFCIIWGKPSMCVAVSFEGHPQCVLYHLRDTLNVCCII